MERVLPLHFDVVDLGKRPFPTFQAVLDPGHGLAQILVRRRPSLSNRAARTLLRSARGSPRRRKTSTGGSSRPGASARRGSTGVRLVRTVLRPASGIRHSPRIARARVGPSPVQAVRRSRSRVSCTVGPPRRLRRT
jgi:hypothetical protein